MSNTNGKGTETNNREQIKKQQQEYEDLIKANDEAGKQLNDNINAVHDAKGRNEENEEEAEKKIKEYLKNHSGKEENEYLVRGAKLCCDCGTNIRRLNLLKCHGVYIGEHAVVHEWDCVQGDEENITWFGICKNGEDLDTEEITLLDDNGNELTFLDKDGQETTHGKQCKPHIIGTWMDTYGDTRIVDNGDKDAERDQVGKEDAEIKGRATITLGSFLVCKHGGIITPASSGQEEDNAVEDDQFIEGAEAHDRVRDIACDEPFEGENCDSLLHASSDKNGEDSSDGEGQYRNVHGSKFFTVIFKDGKEILKKQSVREGESATAPTVSEKEGYRFAGWDREFDCVREDLVVMAVFNKNISVEGFGESKLYAANYIMGVMLQKGYEKEFIAGLIGNLLAEGEFGKFESSAYSSEEKKPKYLKHMDDNHEYRKKASNKLLSNVGMAILIEMTEGNSCGKLSETHKFGFGCVQWTAPSRLGKLVDMYKSRCSSTEIPTQEKCGEIESEFILYELENGFKWIYDDWKQRFSNANSDVAVAEAARAICVSYEIPAGYNTADVQNKRITYAQKWYQNMN